MSYLCEKSTKNSIYSNYISLPARRKKFYKFKTVIKNRNTGTKKILQLEKVRRG